MQQILPSCAPFSHWEKSSFNSWLYAESEIKISQQFTKHEILPSNSVRAQVPISDGRKLFHHLNTKPNPTPPHNKAPQRDDFPGNPLLVAAGGYRGFNHCTFWDTIQKYFSQCPFPYRQVHPALKIQRYISIAFWGSGRAHFFKLPYKSCWIWLLLLSVGCRRNNTTSYPQAQALSFQPLKSFS